MDAIAEKMMGFVAGRGWQCRIVPVHHLSDLKRQIRDRYECGLLNGKLYRDQLAGFSFEPPESLPDAESIIVVAAPVPQVRIGFHWRGSRLAVVLPPTYSAYSATTAHVQSVIASWLGPTGYKTAKSVLPLKTLAASQSMGETTSAMWTGWAASFSSQVSSRTCPALWTHGANPGCSGVAIHASPASGAVRAEPLHMTASCSTPRTV